MELKDKINKLELQAQTTPLGTTCDTRLLFEVLDEVKEYLNANPSEVLKHFNHFEKWYRKICYRVVTSFELDYDLETIKQYILKTQEQEKENARSDEILQKYYQEGITLDSVRALRQERDKYKRVIDVIFKKRIDMWHLIDLLDQTYEMYLAFCKLEGYESDYILTQKEFDLLKEMTKDE